MMIEKGKLIMSWYKERIVQLQLPDPGDNDLHPRLLLEREGVNAGHGVTALFPDGWHDITPVSYTHLPNDACTRAQILTFLYRDRY